MAKQDKPDIPDSAEEEVFLYNLLQKMGCDGEEAIILTKIMLKTISEPILNRMDISSSRMEDQLKAQNEVLDARLKAQDSKYSLLLWFIGVGIGLIIASNFVN